MRYSPYEMKDYGLQHRGGAVLPFNFDPKSTPTELEAFWNLLWLSIPEVDAYLEIKYEDFDSFNSMLLTFPHQKGVLVNKMLQDSPAMSRHLTLTTPAEFWELAAPFFNRLTGSDAPAIREWPGIIQARIGVAQSLVEVRDAATMCQAVIAVDFKAGKRL